PGLTLTVIVNDVDARAASAPTLHVRVVVPEHGIDEETYVTFVSSVSVITMPLETVVVELFVTPIVYVRSVPTPTGSGLSDFVVDKSAVCVKKLDTWFRGTV